MNLDPIFNWSGPHGLPQFQSIDDDSFRAAFDAAMTEHRREMTDIASNRNEPDLVNVVEALELCGLRLRRVSALFWNRAGAHTNETIRAVEREISPLLSRHYSAIARDRDLFARIDALWNKRAALGLNTEQHRVLERHWKGFVRSGAALDDAGQEELEKINAELASLGTKFGQNVLSDESEWALPLTSDDLAGIPDFLRNSLAAAAREHKLDTPYAVTLSRSVIEPFLTFSDRRDLRETAFRAWIGRGEGGKDNRPVVAAILSLRNRKAALLGYADYAAYKLDDTMAKTAGAVEDLLKPVWEKARAKAALEENDLLDLANTMGMNHAIEAWDWRYYSEKMRQKRFDFSETVLKPYLQLDNIIAAALDVAGRLFGLRFEERNHAAWHPDVRAWDVLDSTGALRGVFMGDYFARTSKRSGAWMSALQSQHGIGKGQIPFIYNVMNFAKADEGRPNLLSLDDARTLFHEFGHALHGLLSDVYYPSVAGTSVSRDFVELPSQLYEHWLTVPQILGRFAVHCETGEPMPKALLEKVISASTFNSGFQTVEFTASALMDMAFHTSGDIDDPMAFEAQMLERLEMPHAIVMRHRTPHFGHVFSGDGYSAGYYSYLWSEVLDADAFKAFEESGDVFNGDLAARLKQHVYASGGSLDPEDAYIAFRGRLPEPDAMMEKRGLVT
ncbi:MAG: M3 family metallopeptidase [Rhizobiaceae bacterium]